MPISRFKIAFAATIAVLLWVQMLVPAAAVDTTLQHTGHQAVQPAQNASWIIGWESDPTDQLKPFSKVIRSHPDSHITVAAPLSGMNEAEWLKRVKSCEGIRFVQPNQEVTLSAPAAQQPSGIPNDPLLGAQKYLKQIHMNDAWKLAVGIKSLTVAIVDTGVDFNHPDLKANLLNGINILDPGTPPQDDNGHGTNVAGVIAAIGNNKQGVAGIVSHVKIMPVKTIGADGRGDEDQLGQGIRYAVDHGAKIILLSLGMNRSSLYMREIVQYAEDKGVLMVSASGNENNNVKYPAAYPTVLAVGGINPDNTAVRESNYGPELDIVAPWTVFTTALGGDYIYNQGTSMGAPQVAGVAALLWEKYSELKPYEVRNMIRQTAEDVEAKGWDPYTGYGLLRADRALSLKYRSDFYEPNDLMATAKAFPVDTMIFGEISKASDKDWFFVDAPYDGSISLTMTSANENSANIALGVYTAKNKNTKTYSDILNRTVSFPVKKGRYYVQLAVGDQKLHHPLVYKFTSSFHIYRDPFEENDKQYQAFVLPTRSQTITGTFDHNNDRDWYMLNITHSGTLSLVASTNTGRMDLAVSLQKSDTKPIVEDNNSDGGSEILPDNAPNIDVTPGKYYILVENRIYDKPPAYPVTGEYKLKINYNMKFIDPNEPNNKFYQAAAMSPDTPYLGVIDQASDIDWYSFSSNGKDLTRIALEQIPQNRVMSLSLFDENQKQLAINVNMLGKDRLTLERLLPQGTYYIRITSDFPFQNQMYHLIYHSTPVKAGFQDIAGHWAEKGIVALANKHVINGYPDFTFRPNADITRAEAVTVIAQAFHLTKEASGSFTDVSSNYWASHYIARAKAADIISGYDDGTFAPDQKISRMEMAVMLARALDLQGIQSQGQVFSDISGDERGADLIKTLKQKGWISGFEDGTFRPKLPATRAEFVSMLYRATTN